MMSPFLGVSIVIHVLILFLHQTAVFAQRLVFGFKSKPRRRITVLSRSNEERVIPSIIIAAVILTISGLSFFTLRASFLHKPNTIDTIISTANDANDVWAASEIKILPIPQENALAISKTAAQ
jgi:hypothetical protein